MEDVRTPQLGRVDARPMSPHLGVWRWHVTMAASILTRASAIALYAAALIAAWWAVALAMGPGAYDIFLALAGSWFGKLAMLGIALAFFYHLAAGVRHLIFDSGNGLSVKFANQSAWGCIVFAVVMTLVVAIVAWRAGVYA